MVSWREKRMAPRMPISTAPGATHKRWFQVVPINPPAVHIVTFFDTLKMREMPSATA